MKERGEAGHLYLAPGEAVYLSASVAWALGERVDLWEGPGVLALVTAPEGALRTYRRSSGGAKQVCARGAVRYLLCRFPEGGRVPAWAAGTGLFFGPGAGPGLCLDGSFHRVELGGVSAHKRYRVHADRLTASLALPRRMSAWQRGDVLALVKDSAGPYRRVREEGETFLRSTALAKYCRELWGGQDPFLRELPQGAALSPDYAALVGLTGLEDFRRLELEDREARTVTLRRDRSILLSPEAVRALGRTASVYACGGTLALRSDRAGDVEIQRGEGGGVVRSHRLYQQAAMANPGVETFRLTAEGGLWVMRPEEERGAPLPEAYFCRLLVGGGDGA